MRQFLLSIFFAVKENGNKKIPMKTYFIKTFGCAMNYSDSERIVSFLESYQMKPAKEISKADFVVFNTCGIRQMAEDKSYGKIHNLKKHNPNIKIILTGCVANRPDVQVRLKDRVDLFCEIKDFEKKFLNFKFKALNQTPSFKVENSKPNQENIAYLSTIPKYTNKFQAFVPIMTGCNNFCSYCVVPYARGRETSRSAQEIIEEVKNLVEKGYKEITLLGQNVNSYSGNLESQISNLKSIFNEKIPKNKIIGIGALLQTNSGKFIFQKRDANPKYNPGMIAPFGGGINKNESPISALKRELNEELGIANIEKGEIQEIGNFESHNQPEKYIKLFYVHSVEENDLILKEGEEIVELDLKEALKNNLVTDFTKIVIRQFTKSSEIELCSIKIDFSNLLKKINDILGEFWIRFLSSHPKDMSAELINTITSLEKVCEHVHLPIQSGNNAILKKMNRKYTQSHYLKLIKKIRESFEKNKPGKIYALSTDIIVGFPGETKKQFIDSAEVMKKIDYDMVYFGQFSPRPGTAAWVMKDNVSKEEKVRREKYLNEILKKSSYKNNKQYIGKIHEVLIEKEKDGFYYGKTRTSKNVRIGKEKNNLVGQIIPVKITKANIWNLEGEIYEGKDLSAGRQVIVIAGPTASGKSDVAIKLARKFNGEVISADSRQIYKGMDIGSGKITKAEQRMAKHYMLDIVSPNTDYNVAKFKKQAIKHIEDILSRGKVPIICGGTGFWIKAIVDDVSFPKVKPDWKLREKLEKKSAKNLFEKLRKLDSTRAKSIDKDNKVRLIRAIEICEAIGKVPTENNKINEKYDFLQIAIDWPKEDLKKRIGVRLDQRLRQGMIAEVKRLHEKSNVNWKRLYNFGLEYRWVSEYLRGNVTKEEMREKLYFDIVHYAKRQRTWFNRDKRIKWMPAKNYNDIEKETEKFLK